VEGHLEFGILRASVPLIKSNFMKILELITAFHELQVTQGKSCWRIRQIKYICW